MADSTGTQAQSFKKRFNAHRSAKLAITAANDGQRPELARAAAARVLAISVSQRKRLVKGNRKWEKKAEEEKTPTQAVVTTA
ncbi:hypothetical protein FRB99_009008 [Tulasnella sp. 403]|nr:hypothetical protein FRB99_009008 [Tulasnella sp. 403]